MANGGDGAGQVPSPAKATIPLLNTAITAPLAGRQTQGQDARQGIRARAQALLSQQKVCYNLMQAQYVQENPSINGMQTTVVDACRTCPAFDGLQKPAKPRVQK